jgi:hypothetical protein
VKLTCSVQLWLYLHKRRAHMPTEQAAAEAGIRLLEARAHDEAELAGEYADIDTTETPVGVIQQSTAPAAGTATLRRESGVNAGWAGGMERPAKDGSGATPPQEEDMARPRRKAADQVVEVMKPDFDLAKRIYFGDIKPAQGKVGEHAQEMSTAYKEIKKAAHIQPQAAKLAFKLVEMEESKRDDFLRSFRGLLTVFNIFIPADLVDQAEGKTGESNVIPIGESAKPQLATIPSDDSDLAGGGEDEGHDTLQAAE